jgi:L-fucono-1,5-lactonase
MRIDAHQHLWRYDPQDHAWITDDMRLLRHDYLPADLERNLLAEGLDGSVAVQASQTVAETEWLLDLTTSEGPIRAVVGWAPLVEPAVEGVIERLASRATLRGLRHVLQDEADDDYMLRPDFNRGIATLRRFGLVYDVLIFPRHLQNALRFVDRHPEQPFVLDHAAKPVITARAFDDGWARGIRALAERPHVTCKLSGMVTEVRDPAWSPALLEPYVAVLLESFGPHRLMFGSDWPVCLLRTSYDRWVRAVEGLMGGLSDGEAADVWGGTARRVYGLRDRRAPTVGR